MKNLKSLLALCFAGLMQPVLAGPDASADAAVQQAWLAFSNARGEPSLIRGDVEHESANAVFRVIPDVAADFLDEEKLKLGFDLFHETRLSRDGSLACTSCHVALMGGVDRRPVSFGVGGAQGSLNAPTIFNAALNFRQFWDGRALTLQEQALGPIENAVEFDHDLDSVVAVLENIPDYKGSFNTLYPDGVTAANLADAIAYYETMNFTGLSSPFLLQFEEEHEPTSPQAQRGQQRFVEVGCASCHNGINLGGNSYQQLGVASSSSSSNRVLSDADFGLFGRTGREQDKQVFKVPTLHNVAYTAPFFHDGSVASLTQAVDQMARLQSGRYLANDDIDDIVAFLNSLGDRFAMLGECAASGSYAVTMDCSMKQKTAAAEQDAEAAARAAARKRLPAPDVLAQQHREEYAEALARVAEAPSRISSEMQRIRSDEVAHYDFLQYEHIEMLRHARALSYPPANLEAQQSSAMLEQAAQWQQSAEEYEILIADFLRSEAVSNSAKANYQDLLRILAADADDNTKPLLAEAEQSMLAFYALPGPDTQRRLRQATNALSATALNSDRLDELQTQYQLLLVRQ